MPTALRKRGSTSGSARGSASTRGSPDATSPGATTTTQTNARTSRRHTLGRTDCRHRLTGSNWTCKLTSMRTLETAPSLARLFSELVNGVSGTGGAFVLNTG